MLQRLELKTEYHKELIKYAKLKKKLNLFQQRLI